MKQKFKLCLFAVLFAGIVSCKPKTENVDQSYYYEQVINNLFAELEAANDSIASLNTKIEFKDSLYNIAINNLNTCDSSNINLRSELFVANYKLGRIKEYCDIVKRNKTQLQFLRGWIVRVLED